MEERSMKRPKNYQEVMNTDVVSVVPLKIRERTNLYEGDEGEYVKTVHHPRLIALKSEWNATMGRYRKVYRIEKSNSGLRWVLTIDSIDFKDAQCGWDQKGWYVRTLHGNTLLEALNDAIKKMPEVAVFFSPDASEYHSNDPEFDKWWAQFE